MIPTIPDVLSTYGIPQILSRVKQFSKEIAEEIEPLGIVVTKFQSNSTVHRNIVKRLRANGSPPVFNTIIPQANQFADAAEHQGEMTLKQKWGYGRDLSEKLEELTREILSKLKD